MTESQKIVDIAEAAKMANMNLRTLRRRIAQGELSAVKDPRDKRRRLVRLSDLKDFLGDVPMQQAS